MGDDGKGRRCYGGYDRAKAHARARKEWLESLRKAANRKRR